MGHLPAEVENFADNNIAKITISERSAKCGLFIDGKFVKNLSSSEVVTVSKSKKTVKFFNTNDNFYEKLLIKLNSWSCLK